MPSQQRKFDGAGFGLAMCRKLVQLHHGHLPLESEGEGQSCRFSVILPLSQDEPAGHIGDT